MLKNKIINKLLFVSSFILLAFGTSTLIKTDISQKSSNVLNNENLNSNYSLYKLQSIVCDLKLNCRKKRKYIAFQFKDLNQKI